MRRETLLVVSMRWLLLCFLLQSAGRGQPRPEKARNARLCSALTRPVRGKPVLAEVRLEVVGTGPPE